MYDMKERYVHLSPGMLLNVVSSKSALSLSA